MPTTTKISLSEIIADKDQKTEQMGVWSWTFTLLIAYVTITIILNYIKLQQRRQAERSRYINQFNNELLFLEVFGNQNQWTNAVQAYPPYEGKIIDRLLSDKQTFKDNIASITRFCNLCNILPTLSVRGAEFIVNNDDLFNDYIESQHNDLKHLSWNALAQNCPAIHDKLIDRIVSYDDLVWTLLFPSIERLSQYIRVYNSTRLNDFIVNRLIENKSLLFSYIDTDSSVGFNDISLLLKAFPEKADVLLDALSSAKILLALNQKKSGLSALLADQTISAHHIKIASLCVANSDMLRKIVAHDQQMTGNSKHINFQTRFPQFATEVAKLKESQFANYLIPSSSNNTTSDQQIRRNNLPTLGSS